MQDAARVLILATSHKTRGGITSVLKEHEQSRYWKTFKCRWLETHRDGNICIKIGYFLKSFLTYIFILPSYDLVHIHTSEPPSALRKIFLPCMPSFGGAKSSYTHTHSLHKQLSTAVSGLSINTGFLCRQGCRTLPEHKSRILPKHCLA